MTSTANPEHTEDDLLSLSLLQHVVFCPRRAALVHLETLWEDNIFTIDGTHLHQKTGLEHSVETRGDIRTVRGLRLRSFRLGLSGIADVVEFHRVTVSPNESNNETHGNVSLPGLSGRWRPFPVEYKRGRLRHETSFEVQLCAQAICLEEMLQTNIPEGAIFYGKTRRRKDIVFTDTLRTKTKNAAAQLHELIDSRKTPPARYEKKCDKCSLLNICMPKTVGKRRSVRTYLAKAFEHEGE